MNRVKFKHLLLAIVAIAALATLGLWSWNTLADLVGAPDAQFRHAVAALGLLATLRLVFYRHGSTGLRRHRRF